MLAIENCKSCYLHYNIWLVCDWPIFVRQGLPSEFCKRHLPNKDSVVTLVDEDEEEFHTKYLADKNGLSGGWRGFSIEHQLVDGDALVFHLVRPTVFKVISTFSGLKTRNVYCYALNICYTLRHIVCVFAEYCWKFSLVWENWRFPTKPNRAHIWIRKG